MIILISILLPLSILNIFVNAKAMKDETGKYQQMSKWLDVCFKLVVVSYLYMMILKFDHPSVIISIILFILSIATIVVDLPIKIIQKRKYAPYCFGISIISFAILAVYAITTLHKTSM